MKKLNHYEREKIMCIALEIVMALLFAGILIVGFIGWGMS